MYGPDDRTTTKIAAGVILHDGAEAIIRRWVATDVTTNPKVQQEMREFFLRHGVQSVAMSEGNLGCRHEEGEDFPHGEDCPFCPFWKGKQGSGTTGRMAELPDEATALHFENTIQGKIAAFGNIKHSETLRYWKIPEWFEINFSLRPCTDPAFAYDGILSSLGERWERHDFPGEYQWAVRNPNQDSTFFSSDVRWANVERFPES